MTEGADGNPVQDAAIFRANDDGSSGRSTLTVSVGDGLPPEPWARPPKTLAGTFSIEKRNEVPHLYRTVARN